MAKRHTIQRKADDELDDDLRPSVDAPDPGLPRGSELINDRFVAFGGKPQQLNDVASLSSAGLVIAEQLSEMVTAIHVLTFLMTKDSE